MELGRASKALTLVDRIWSLKSNCGHSGLRGSETQLGKEELGEQPGSNEAHDTASV